ncbi:hypothetical protein LCGC14_1547140 [marine sediment metagenome]|uniref:Lipid II flippase MurJ n=1 Tax=marine sediment metagenome TaxID=412755 RepID=A0A0F9IRB5_9ZZZZ
MQEQSVTDHVIDAKIGKKSFARNTMLMSVLTSISRVTGFIRLIALAAVLGETVFLGSLVTDSFNLANVIPNYIYELVLGGILSSIIIPIFIEYMTKKGEKEAFKVASIITNMSLIILGAIALLGTVLPNFFVKSLTFLSGGENIELAVFFFRFFAIQVVFYGLAAMTTGILYSYRRFGVPTFAPIINNLTVIITIIFFYGYNIKSNPEFAMASLAVGTTLGVFLMFAIQVPSLFKIGFRYVPSFDFRHPAIKKAAVMSFPLFLYVIGNVAPMWVEVGLGWRYRNAVTSLQWAWPFFQLPFGIFAVSVVNALFPVLSENFAKGDIDEFKKQISLGLRTIGMIMWPASAALIVLSKPIISLTLKHGNFTTEQAVLTAGVLSYFSLGLFFFAAFYFLLRAFYARQDTLTPALISIATMVFNIGIDFVLINTSLSVMGLALGRSITYFLNFALIWIMLRRKIGPLDKRVVTSNVKFFSAAVLMGIVGFVSLNMFSSVFGSTALQSRFLLFGLPALLSGLVYMTTITVLKSPEIKLIRDLVSRRR